MKFPPLASLLLVVTPLAFLAGPAGAQNLESLFAGGEIYRTQSYGNEHVRFDRLSLAADGSFRGDTLIEHYSWSGLGFTEERAVSGRWRITGNRFCLSETRAGPEVYRNGAVREFCYDLRRVRTDGVYIDFHGTEIGTGLPWLFKVAPAS